MRGQIKEFVVGGNIFDLGVHKKNYCFGRRVVAFCSG